VPLFDLDIPRVPDAAITVDAVADERAWADALVLPEFVSFRPVPDQVPSGRTVVRVVADDRGMWFHVQAFDAEPHRIRAGYGRRDARTSDDAVGVYLDPAGEVQRSYKFQSNTLGVQTDGTNAAGAPEDLSWDARWWSAGRVTDTGYEVEIGIPWRAVRHPRQADRMGIWVYRVVPRTGERSSWPRLDPNVSGLLVQEAIVGGPGLLPRDIGLDLIPELTYGATQDGAPSGRFTWQGIGPAVTARYSPSARLQALATVNPDFSQVESDASMINLNQRFALYFQERRPFFLEGQEAFTHALDNLLYTRSMSAPVYGVRATSEFGGTTAAVLHVLDAAPLPSVSENGGWTEEDVAGYQALDTVARVRQSIAPDSFVGLLVSDKTLLGTDRFNRLGGFDLRYRLSPRWAMEGSALASVTRADGVGEGLAPAGNLAAYYGSRALSYWTTTTYVHPDFRAENGFITAADRLTESTGFGIDFYPGGRWIPTWGISPATVSGTLNHDGQLRLFSYLPEVWLQLRNGVEVTIGAAHAGDLYAGELLVTDRAVVEVTGAWTEWLRTTAAASTGTGALYDPVAPTVGWKEAASWSVTLQPWERLALTGSGSAERLDVGSVGSYAGWVGRLKLEAYASRRLWARAIVDRTTFSDRDSAELLTAYEYWPGSAVYLGGSHQWYGDPSVANTWAVFAKASWVLPI
jgi:hypothetical protein